MYHADTDTPFSCRTTNLNEDLGQVRPNGGRGREVQRQALAGCVLRWSLRRSLKVRLTPLCVLVKGRMAVLPPLFAHAGAVRAVGQDRHADAERHGLRVDVGGREAARQAQLQVSALQAPPA